MADVLVISSDRNRARILRESLEIAGQTVQVSSMSETVLRELHLTPPQAIIFDLDRAPASSRDLGLSLRVKPATRGIILVFLGGKVAKVQEIQHLLPDAVFTDEANLLEDLVRGLANPPREPIVPESVFAGYSGRPLPAKLGIKSGMRVALIGAPPDFEQTLTSLPRDVILDHNQADSAELTLWFVTSQVEMMARLADTLNYAAGAKLWILWPKKASGVRSDLTQAFVRQVGLDNGWVDFKICAVDATWSGLCFTERKEGPE
jgi:hypothetical protein